MAIYSIWATKVTSEFKNQPVAEWEWFEGTWPDKQLALARCRALTKPSRWEPRVFQLRDDKHEPASRFYTNRPELLIAFGLKHEAAQ